MRRDRHRNYRNYRTGSGRRRRTFRASLLRAAGVLCLLLVAYGGADYYRNGNLDRTAQLLGQVKEQAEAVPEKLQEFASQAEDAILTLRGVKKSSFPLDAIPEYSGEPYVVIDDGVPDFTDEDRAAGVYEYYSELDYLGRCGAAQAMLGPELMPGEERGEISSVRPSGWHTAKYDIVEDQFLYHRCHLIAYALTGENANEKNLITGTEYMNMEGMLPWELQVIQYVRSSGCRVLYRVTPIYRGSDLVARGVHMEAESVQDREIRFNVFVYNVQPGIEIDYSDGSSWLGSAG